MCSVEVKTSLFRTYCTSLYTAHLLTKYSESTLRNFYTAYHNVMKLFIGLPKREHTRPICVSYDIPYGPALLRNLIYRFMCRLQESQNMILYTINQSDCQYDSPPREKWKSLYISKEKKYKLVFSMSFDIYQIFLKMVFCI